MHMPIARACLKLGKHLTTSSYISPDMKALDQQAKEKGLIFLNESGLDPGIDIMSTMKVLDECKEKGWKIVSYESYCGGLPVAE
jgi:saccharopine dehydrogenase-like NADP-dependent oxidoreductase